VKATESVSAADRYWITEQGRYDLIMSPHCQCNPHLAGLLIECAKCGTVYGTVRESMDWGRGRNGKRD
jgi:hypothetical protein